VDLSKIANRICYVAGGYKYAMAGEGAAFLDVPAHIGARPRGTGWYAGYEDLERVGSAVTYPKDARRFLGATAGYSASFRLNAVMDLLASEKLAVAAMTEYARNLQISCLDSLARSAGGALKPLLDPHQDSLGRFLTFETPRAGEVANALGERGI